jgi:outer membrane protein OmpA-like peptidoglycan-associated protein
MMISSKDANQLIADCYIARSDFVQENPKLARAFVEAVAYGADHIAAPTFEIMASFYGLKTAAEAQAMLGDVHIANFPETQMFFDPKNSIGAKKIFRLSQEYSKDLGVLPQGTNNDPADVLATSFADQIQKAGLFAAQKNTVANSFNTPTPLSFSDLENKNVVLTDNVQLFFDPNQDTFDINSGRQDFRQNMEMLDKVFEQSRFLSTTAIELIGNADPSMKEQARAKGPDALAQAAADIQELSENRANFVRKILIEHYKLPENRIISKGVGWDNPIDLKDYAKDRRVDVKFVSLK